MVKRVLQCFCAVIVASFSVNLSAQNSRPELFIPNPYDWLSSDTNSNSFWNLDIRTGVECIGNKNSYLLNMDATYIEGLSFGRAFCLNDNSYSNVLFYVDWTILDILFADYSEDFMKKYGAGTIYFFNADIGTFIGPRVNLGQKDGCNVGIYCRYAPTLTTYLNGQFNSYDTSFSHQFSAGIDFGYDFICFGVDFRRAYTNCDFILKDDYAYTMDQRMSLIQKNNIIVYLTFRF